MDKQTEKRVAIKLIVAGVSKNIFTGWVKENLTKYDNLFRLDAIKVYTDSEGEGHLNFNPKHIAAYTFDNC